MLHWKLDGSINLLTWVKIQIIGPLNFPIGPSPAVAFVRMAEEKKGRIAGRVVIIGGGVGGLALAGALQERGIKWLIIERFLWLLSRIEMIAVAADDKDMA